jgi:hypothetical protein
MKNQFFFLGVIKKYLTGIGGYGILHERWRALPMRRIEKNRVG